MHALAPSSPLFKGGSLQTPTKTRGVDTRPSKHNAKGWNKALAAEVPATRGTLGEEMRRQGDQHVAPPPPPKKKSSTPLGTAVRPDTHPQPGP